MRVFLEWSLVGIMLAGFLCGVIVFTTTFGFEAACGLYRFLVRQLRYWRARRLMPHQLQDDDIHEWLQSSDQDS